MTTTPTGQDRCRALLEELSRYIDGELTGADRRVMVRHLHSCLCCQHLAEGLKQTVDLCQKAGATRLPGDLRARARARITMLLASGAPTRRRS